MARAAGSRLAPGNGRAHVAGVGTDPQVPTEPLQDRPIRAAVVGMSDGTPCGALDHATLLAHALSAENVSCSMHWLERNANSPRAAFAEIRGWARALAAELERGEADAILLHYSTFSYAHRGVPMFVRPTIAGLRRTRIPIVTVLHEFAYPWRAGDWRGNLWAVTQRAALIDVMRASRAAVVTADFRADWLHSRPWLPRREVALAPVFSNLPPPAQTQRAERREQVLGLFGYSYESASLSLVLDALGALLDRGLAVQLRLLGAPGASSPAGEQWRSAADARRIAKALSFTGVLSPQELSNALADCDVLLFADSPGPTSRKGTLAGSLASGRPVIAIDGPRTWAELTRAGATRVVAPTASALADALGDALGDEQFRAALGARGRTFAERQMGLAHSAEVVASLLGEVLSGPAGAPPSARSRP
jgi:glycosyltransferase involved in cell wall biosynthesis